MKIKDGVNLGGLSVYAAIAAFVAEGVYKDFGYEAVITSAVDSKHKVASKHYLGHAIDLRINNLPDLATATNVANQIRSNLGLEYDVILEGDHIHIEYDPKKGINL